jgi:carboxyl-terminal processing protease
MTPRYTFAIRPFHLFVLLSAAFGLGLSVERFCRLIAPYQYTRPGLERTFAPFWEAWDKVDKHFVIRDRIVPEHMTRGAIEGMLASLGDAGHTSYRSPREFKQMESGLEGRMVGIGARMMMRRRLPTFVTTVAGSPARAAGLRPGDVLRDVDGESVAGLPLDQIIEKVKGPVGTRVHLGVARAGQSEPLHFDIERSEIEVPEVTWCLVPGKAIAHVAIQSFGQNVHAQLKEALEQARRHGATAVIVDVRGNAGGLTDQAVAVTSEFLKDGTVFLQRDAKGEQTAEVVKPGGAATEIPLCVLIDQFSASSAEIFAGAIQDHARGKLVGRRTIGTGTVLSAFLLSDGSAILLAVAEWLTPNGRQIWHKGIAPDIEVPLPDGSAPLLPENEADLDSTGLAKSEDKQLLKAVEVLQAQTP